MSPFWTQNLLMKSVNLYLDFLCAARTLAVCNKKQTNLPSKGRTPTGSSQLVGYRTHSPTSTELTRGGQLHKHTRPGPISLPLIQLGPEGQVVTGLCTYVPLHRFPTRLVRPRRGWPAIFTWLSHLRGVFGRSRSVDRLCNNRRWHSKLEIYSSFIHNGKARQRSPLTPCKSDLVGGQTALGLSAF